MGTLHLSIIICGRNDNYGGDFKKRLENCVNWTFSQLEKQNYTSEIIFVNYNPIDSIPIEKFIQWPQSSSKVNVRIITVSNDIHKYIVNKYSIKDVPVIEYIAKNAGITRSLGEYILCMNPDILIDEEIFKRFNNLSPNYYYRCNRCDYINDVYFPTQKKLFDEVKNNIISVWYKGRKKKTKGINKFSYYLNWLLRIIDNTWKYNTTRIRFVLNTFNINVYYHNVEFKYHCNASGDFMLMNKKHWLELKGYKESSYISLHTDSLFVVQAAMNGIIEKTFLKPIYHKEHERRYNTDIENIEHRKIYLKYQEEAQKMVCQKKSIIYNNDDWGLVNFKLEEVNI